MKQIKHGKWNAYISFGGTDIAKQEEVEDKSVTSKRFKITGPTIKFKIERKDNGK